MHMRKVSKSCDAELFTIINNDGSDYETDYGHIVSFYSLKEAEDFINTLLDAKYPTTPNKYGILKYKLMEIYEYESS